MAEAGHVPLDVMDEDKLLQPLSVRRPANRSEPREHDRQEHEGAQNGPAFIPVAPLSPHGDKEKNHQPGKHKTDESFGQRGEPP